MTIDLLHAHWLSSLGRSIGIFRELGENDEHLEARIQDARILTASSPRASSQRSPESEQGDR